MSKKISADKNLAIEQFKELNKEFYSNFMDEYYFIKLENLLNIISRTEKYIDNIEKQEIEIGKLKCKFGDSSSEKVKQYSKIELTTTYFHCLETFIRLFIAHSSLTGCPWLDISRLSIQDYRNSLRKLSKGDFDWLNSKMNSENTILFTLLGYSEIPKEMNKKDIDGLREWIIWAANELLNNYEYNTYKHGLAIYTNINGFSLGSSDKVKIKKEGECLQFLSRKEKESRYVWQKNIVFIPYDSRATIIFIFAHLIKNIISVGRYMYANGEYKIDWVPNHKFNPEFIFKSDEEVIPGIPIQVKGYSVELLYYK